MAVEKVIWLCMQPVRADSSLAEKKLVTQDAISETIILPGADRNKAIAPIKTIETLPEHDD